MVCQDAFSSISSGRERRGSLAKLRKDKREDIEESKAPLASQRHTDADTATRTVNPTMAKSVTPDTAQAAGLIQARLH